MQTLIIASAIIVFGAIFFAVYEAVTHKSSKQAH